MSLIAYALCFVTWGGETEKSFKIFEKMLTHTHEMIEHLVELSTSKTALKMEFDGQFISPSD